jgi:cyclopropane-fatty-acyl-phospholipid synthase
MLDYLLNANLAPDFLVKTAIKFQLRQRIYHEHLINKQSGGKRQQTLLAEFQHAPIALATDSSLSQHYAVPTEFFKYVLGKQMKYSAALWEKADDLDQAEEAMLALYCSRLAIKDGDSILDLGCGWGSVSLYIAKRFPNANICAMSHSNTQRKHIEEMAKHLQLTNIQVITADINHAKFPPIFDKIISIEMFEHLRNHAALLKKLASWLRPEGLLFVHHFCHREFLYTFDDENSWMARHFFTAGMMPNFNYLENFTQDFALIQQWKINGLHYQKTALAWLYNLRIHQKEIIDVFTREKLSNPRLYWHYWRLFFLACAELFGYNDGNDWFLGHYLLKRK